MNVLIKAFPVLNKIKSLALSSTARQTLILFSANFLEAISAFVIIIILARTLQPERFGLYTTYINFILLTTSILDLGIGASLIRFLPVSSAIKKRLFIKTAVNFSFITALFVALLILVFNQPVNYYVFLSTVNFKLIFFISLGTLLLIVYSLLTQILQAKLLFSQAALASYIYTLTRFSLIFFLFYSQKLNMDSAVIVTALTPLPSLIFMIIKFIKNHEIGFGSLKYLQKILHFSRWIAVVHLNAAINLRVDTIMLLNLSGAYATGIYAAAAKPAAFLPLLNNSYSRVISPQFSILKRKSEIINFLKKAFFGSSILCLADVFLIFTAPLYMNLLYGYQYQDSIMVIRFLLLAMIPSLLSFPLINSIIYTFIKPQLITIITIVQSLLFILGSLILIPNFGVYGLIWSLLLSNLMIFFSSLFIVVNHLKSYAE